MHVRRFPSALLLASLLTAGTDAMAQPKRQAAPAPAPAPDAPPLTAAEVQRLFDAATVYQAQDALGLSESQYGRFVTRFKAMQDVKRRHQIARNQILAELRKLTGPQAQAPAEDNVLSERLKTLREEDERAAAELKKAYDGVDETLDVRQQARFRLFEERMEQRKLELLMRARQNARAATGRRGRGSE